MSELGGLKAINIRGGHYVMVHTKVAAFRKLFPNGRIESDILGDPKDWVFVRSKVTPNVEHPEQYFIGHSQAKWTGNINGAAALENAETSAVGRALSMMGIGIEGGMCSAEELDKAKATPAPSNVVMLEKEKPASENMPSLANVTEDFVSFCETNQITDADLYRFARSLTASSCKKLGISHPAVPQKGHGEDSPFIGVADTALLAAIVKHSKLVLERIRGEVK